MRGRFRSASTSVHWGTCSWIATAENAFEETDAQKLQVFADIVGIAIIKDRLFEENLRLERVDRETGLEKYLPFLEKLGSSVARAQEVHGRVAVVLLDVDNFKQIVNTFGTTVPTAPARDG